MKNQRIVPQKWHSWDVIEANVLIFVIILLCLLPLNFNNFLLSFIDVHDFILKQQIHFQIFLLENLDEIALTVFAIDLNVKGRRRRLKLFLLRQFFVRWWHTFLLLSNQLSLVLSCYCNFVSLGSLTTSSQGWNAIELLPKEEAFKLPWLDDVGLDFRQTNIVPVIIKRLGQVLLSLTKVFQVINMVTIMHRIYYFFLNAFIDGIDADNRITFAANRCAGTVWTLVSGERVAILELMVLVLELLHEFLVSLRPAEILRAVIRLPTVNRQDRMWHL